MKDFSFDFLKNLMGTKMGKGFRNFCNNGDSTSTLNQHELHNNPYKQEPNFAASQVPSSDSCMGNDSNIVPNVPPRKSVTLEEMILQLEQEEEMARKERAARCKFKEEEEEDMRSKFHQRMSCVNNSDILRSARKALNHYPRFSLDGRDAMYKSSFKTNMDGLKLGKILHLPKSLGGESVVWCKPGVVPKLMGLEVMPVPVTRYSYNDNNKRRDKENLCNAIRSQNLRRRAQRNEMERRQKRHVHVTDSTVCWGSIKRSGRSAGTTGGGGGGSCTSTGYCVMNPIAMEPVWGPVSFPSPYN